MVARELAAAARVIRYRGDSAAAEPRSVRLAALGLGLLLLVGAIATYVILMVVAGPSGTGATHGSAAAQAGAWSPERR